jgi:DNA-binding XRE family transcriptional regulator
MAKKDSSITNFNVHLTGRYGARGSERRTEFEIKAKAFLIGELIKEERKLANLTQEELANKVGAKKSFISRIENGHSDIQLSTLYRLIELGLGRKINLTIQ